MAPAEGQSGPAALAGCSARRWLARNAAGVKLIERNELFAAASACTSLVSCLPALEDVELRLPGPTLSPDDLGCLLEALAWCPRLRALSLVMDDDLEHCVMYDGYEEGDTRFPGAPAFAQLTNLTKLELAFGEEPGEMYEYPWTARNLRDVVTALVPLTALAELAIDFPAWGQGRVPAALAQLMGLRALKLCCLDSAVLEAGCLDLPNLASLEFQWCMFYADKVLPSATALQSLTRLNFIGCSEGPPWAAAMPRLPTDMGALSTSLKYFCFSNITLFPWALTQLVALEHLDASGSGFMELPAAILALSRLTELALGRAYDCNDPFQLRTKRPLDVRALGNLSGLPALCRLTLDCCEVMLCESVLGVARHASLASLCFSAAHPAPECAPVVLQLSQALRLLGRGSVLKLVDMKRELYGPEAAAVHAQGQTPFAKFKAAMQARGGV